MSPMSPPVAPGLYDPAHEHDACGIGLVARLHNGPTHEVVERAILAVEHLYHRGATGADADTGDGAGILLDIPDALLREAVDFTLPVAGQYAVAMCFLPSDDARRAELEALLDEAVEAEGQRVLGWRDVPVAPEHCGRTARLAMPVFRQLFVGASSEPARDRDAFERKVYVIRRVAEMAAGPDLVMPSFSARTIVYKGMLTSLQLSEFYPDLRDERVVSRSALVHARFSTNTFPSWELAHPYRMIAHNGEINTLMGNVNWMRARESQLRSELFGDDLRKVLPVVRPGGSDSATLDNVLELLVLSGRSLPHAVMTMIPEAHAGREDVTPELRGFYDYHSCLMEPWDGPAAVAFCDGRWAGATLDRNGLRPGRWVETASGYVVLASEAGVLPIQEEGIVRKGRLQPGRLFLVDLDEGRVVEDAEIKQLFAQVTNPAIDPIRESIVMSLASGVGPSGNLLDETPEHAHQLVMRQPILRDHELERLRQVSHDVFRSHTIDITWPVAEGPDGMEGAVECICQEAHDKVAEGVNVLILSD